MDDNLDTGDIVNQIEVEIDLNDTWINVNEKTKLASQELLKNELPKILNGQNKRIKQNKKLSTTNFRLDASYPKINFTTMSDIKIYNLIRAQVKPLSGAYIKKDEDIKYIDEILTLEEVQELRVKYDK